MSWEPQPRQAAFLSRREYMAFYGGAKGGGKTDALLLAGIIRCRLTPHVNALMLRRTFADFEEPGAAIPRSHELLTTAKWHWDGQNHRWTAPNKSVLQFGHLKDMNAMYKYQGAQIDILLWDELTQFLEQQFDFVTASVRATVEGGQPLVRAAGNPGGVGHAWVRKRFVDVAAPGQPFDLVRPEDGRTIVDVRTGQPLRGVFVPAKVDDNPALLRRDPGYKSRLEMLPSDLRRAFLEGDWDIFAGQYFPEWRRDVHTCRPFAIPPGWMRWRAVDYGYHAPMCCLWFVRSPDSQVYVYRELYATQMLDAEQAVHIRGLSQDERIVATYADPSMWSTQPNGSSIQAVYSANGVPCAPANNDRLAGWQKVHAALMQEPTLQVFDTCENLIRTLPALVHDQHRVEDVDTNGEDHAPDALRYGLMGGPTAARQRVTKAAYGWK